MNWSTKSIRKAFSGRLIGPQFMKTIICKTLLCLPSEMIKYITSSVWFISSQGDSWAFTMKGSDIKGQYLIFLPDELLRQHDHHIEYTILHEIGHIVLRHKNSMGYRQHQTEIKHQDHEADKFANNYLSNRFSSDVP